MDWTWTDVLIHLLAYPVYQILGTIKHEGAHAILARSFGATITEFRFLPQRRDGRWLWGYVKWSRDLDRDQTRVTLMAPYIVDVFMIASGAALVHMYEFTNFHWMAFAVIMLLLSPAVDMLYNVLKWAIRGSGDFADSHELRPR